MPASPNAFARTARALEMERFGRSAPAILTAALVLAAWCAWFALARVAVYAVADSATVHASQTGSLEIVADFPVAQALGRVQPGQPARLRLEAFPWTQYGTVAATVQTIAADEAGRVQVVLAVIPDPDSLIPLQPGLSGILEVEVEQVAPAVLVLRAAGGPR